MNRVPQLCLFCGLLLLQVSLASVVALAQVENESISLLNVKAARKVDKKFNKDDQRVMRGVSANSRDYSLASAFQVDTAESVLLNNKRSSDFFANYKAAAYLTYVRGVVDVGEILAYEEEDAANHVVILESLRFANDHVVQPAMGEFYDSVIEQLRYIRDKTTLSVVKSGTGDLDVSQGSSSTKALLQFRIHASARNGIEPRFTFGDSLKLRLQPLEKKMLFELSFTF